MSTKIKRKIKVQLIIFTKMCENELKLQALPNGSKVYHILKQFCAPFTLDQLVFSDLRYKRIWLIEKSINILLNFI